MQGIQVLIDQLSKSRNIHISILDLSGILDTPNTRINFKNVVHSKPFCEIAKSTPRGYRVCLLCKKFANSKSITDKEPFMGYCAYGIFEVAYPVIMGGNVAAVVYVGNAIVKRDETYMRIHQICKKTGVDEEKIIKASAECEFATNKEELFQISQLVADYLRLVCKNKVIITKQGNWLVSLMKRHADEMYTANISLKDIAVTCKKNEKYLGRLFKKQMDMSFGEYCMQLRLQKAEEMLLQSDFKVIDIAFECGFNNISYFNRMFKQKYGTSPRKYRIECEKG